MIRHPKPAPAEAPARAPDLAEIERIIRTCGTHLLRSFAKNGFIPTYAAFNLLGDADMGGREMLMALTGLNSRGYKNSTLLFNLARIFIAHSPARALINPPWTGIAEPMWEPMQIRHRSAYYDAFFTEALLGFVETGLASADQTAASRRAISDMVDFCLTTSAEEVPSHDGSTVRVITALAPLPHPRFSKFFFQIKQDLGFGIYVPDCDTTACSFSAATQVGSTDPILDQPLLDFYAGYQVAQRRQRAARDGAAQRQCRVRGRRRDLDRQSRRRPALRQRPRSRRSISTSSKSASAIMRAGRSSRRRHGSRRFTASSASRGGWCESGALRQSALAHLLSAGAVLGLFRPLLRGLHRAAGGGAAGDRSRRQFRVHPRPRCWPMSQGELIAHEMNAFDAALALMALAHLGADAGELRACAGLHRRAISAKAAGTAPTRPMSGTR